MASVCMFTRIPDFFFHFGFRLADRTTLPDKIYKDGQAVLGCMPATRWRWCAARCRGSRCWGRHGLPSPELVKATGGSHRSSY